MTVSPLLDLLMVLAGLTALAVAANLRRRPVEPDELEPNCLLTKHPIEFWTGTRSLFHFRETWGDLPLDLAAHGYEVRVKSLPWSDGPKRRAAAENALSSPCHLVVDRGTALEFARLFHERPPLSVTVVDPPLASALDRFCFRVHSVFLWVTGSPKPLVGAPKIDPSRSLRTSIRSLAEEDWQDFPLEGSSAT